MGNTIAGTIAFLILQQQLADGVIYSGNLSISDIVNTKTDYLAANISYEQYVALAIQKLAQAVKGTSRIRAIYHALGLLQSSPSTYFFENHRLLSILSARGFQVGMVTAEPDYVAQAVGIFLGRNLRTPLDIQSTVLEVDPNGIYTGNVTRQIVSAEDKAAAAKKIIGGFNGPVIGLGDAVADIGLWSLATHPIIVAPTVAAVPANLQDVLRRPTTSVLSPNGHFLRATSPLFQLLNS